MTEGPISEDLATYEDLDEVAHVYNLLDETLRKDHQQFEGHTNLVIQVQQPLVMW
jgi:hypothetical protein